MNALRTFSLFIRPKRQLSVYSPFFNNNRLERQTNILGTINLGHVRGRSRTAATSKMERFVIIHKALHRGCCSRPRSASACVLLVTYLFHSSVVQVHGQWTHKSCFHQHSVLYCLGALEPVFDLAPDRLQTIEQT